MIFRTTTSADGVFLDKPPCNARHGNIDVNKIYRYINGKHALFMSLLKNNIAPDVLDNILTNAPALRASLNNPIDSHDWSSFCEFQERKSRGMQSLYKSWWVTVTRLPIHLAGDTESLKILIKHGADVHAVCGISDAQKRFMLPEFEQVNTTSRNFSQHRAAIIKCSEYRKQSFDQATNINEDIVLGYDNNTNTVTMDESLAIGIRLKQDYPREAILQDTPELLALLELTGAFKHTNQYASILPDSANELSNYSKAEHIGDISKQLDYCLENCVFDVSYSPDNNYVDVTLHIEYHVLSLSNKHETVIPIRLPFSKDNTHNAIESISFMAISVKNPLDIAMFFTYGYEFLSHQRPHNIMHLAVARKKYDLIRYLVSEGVDPLKHNPNASTHPPIVGMLGDSNDPNLTFYLQRMSHRALEFFVLCLENQFYQQARRIIIKSKEPVDYDSLCKRRPIDVERLIMTNAMDPYQAQVAGHSQSSCSPKAFAWYKFTNEHQFAIEPNNFKRILQFCPELMYAFVANSNLIDNYDKKIKKIMLHALDKEDHALIEFLISDRVNINWPRALNNYDMSLLYNLCISRKKHRKIAVKIFAQWIKNQPNTKKELPETTSPTYLDKDAHLPITNILTQTLEQLSDAERTWLEQYCTIQEHIIYPESMTPIVSSLSDNSITTLSTCHKPFDELTYNAWLSWINIGRDVLDQRRKIEQKIATLTTSSITHDQYNTLMQSAARYQKKTAGLIELLASHEATFQSCVTQKASAFSKVDNFDKDTEPATVSMEKSAAKLTDVVAIDNKLIYRRLLLSYYTHDFLPLGDITKSMQIARFFVLLHEIQETMDSKFVVHAKLLPTVRNIYIHYGAFFKTEHMDTLHESIAHIGTTLHNNNLALKTIKQQVTRFVETAFQMALDTFGINHHGFVIDDTLKFSLYNLYHKACPTLRLERLRTLLVSINDTGLSFNDYTQATLSEKLLLHFIILEIGEHLKADGLRIIQACKQSYMDQDQHDLIVVRGKYLHSFLLPGEGEQPISNIIEMSLNEEQFSIVQYMYKALIPCVKDKDNTLSNHSVFTESEKKSNGSSPLDKRLNSI